MARKTLLELQAVTAAVESTGQAKAEAQVWGWGRGMEKRNGDGEEGWRRGMGMGKRDGEEEWGWGRGNGIRRDLMTNTS